MSTTNPFNRYREPMMYNGWREPNPLIQLAENRVRSLEYKVLLMQAERVLNALKQVASLGL